MQHYSQSSCSIHNVQHPIKNEAEKHELLTGKQSIIQIQRIQKLLN